ncbi:TonB-dependent receptor [Novosphingobium sp. M1R2S20]|uniref:TonB-dependent receptor n=1 Tax=Novosphingobium rhizovicinum TaxID=3228928 RepID=A0ABV3RCY4_9SPHN
MRKAKSIARFLCGSAVLSVFYTSAAASAQVESAANDAQVADVSTQQSSRTSAASNDIIVTARRVEERLQDVPISITAFTQEQLNNRNVVSARDLAQYTPSLTANTRYGADNTTFTIRGFSQEQRTTASVGVYFADVVTPRGSGTNPGGDGAGPGYFFDLQNVQVLKGPQGTLFGRNTTGGAVLLVPQRPTDSLEGYVEGSYGNYDMRRLQGVVNVPVGDTFRVRAGVDWQKRDGYLRNTSGIGPDRFGDVDYVAGRVSAVADLSPDLENYTVVSFSRSSNNGIIASVDQCFPFLPNVNGALAPTAFGNAACAQIAREEPAGFYAVSNSLPDAQVTNRQWQIVNRTSWQVSDRVTIRNIASYAEFKGKQRSDLFGLLASPPGVFPSLPFVTIRNLPGFSTNDQATITEELQVQGTSNDDRLSYQFGGYLELAEPGGFSGVQNPTAMACVDSDNFQCPAARSTMSRAALKTSYRTMAAYGQASYKLSDTLKVTGGLRYTWDKVRSEAIKHSIAFPAANTPVLYCTDASTGPVAGGTQPGYGLDRLFNSCTRYDEQSTDAPTWLLGLDYTPVRDVLVYAKWARGYRQGGTASLSADGYNTYDAEKVDSYEIGAKTSWRGAVPGTFNIAAFYNDFSNQQIQVGFQRSAGSPPPTIPPTIGIINVGQSRIYGAEVEAGLEPFEGLRIDGAYAYINTKLQEVTPISLNPDSLYNRVNLPTPGNPLPFTPKHKASVTASYTLPLAQDVGAVTIGGTVTTQSRTTIIYTPNGVLPGYTLVNLNLNWNEIFGSRVDGSLFVTNLTKKKYYTHVNDQGGIGQVGFASYYLGEPRMFGARLKVRFGD